MTDNYISTPGTDRRIHAGEGGIPFFCEVSPGHDPLGLTGEEQAVIKFRSPSGDVRTKTAAFVAGGAGASMTIDDDRGHGETYYVQLTCTVIGDEIADEEFFDEVGVWTRWAEITPAGAPRPLIGTATEFHVFAAGAA